MPDAQFALIPYEALVAMARGLGYGAQKYAAVPGAAFNWKQRDDYTYRHVASKVIGHLYQFLDRKTDESGLDHLDHALADLAILAHHVANRPELDDRYTSPPSEAEPALSPADLLSTDGETPFHSDCDECVAVFAGPPAEMIPPHIQLDEGSQLLFHCTICGESFFGAHEYIEQHAGCVSPDAKWQELRRATPDETVTLRADDATR